MRVLIVNTDYPEFLQWLYDQHPGLAESTYEEQVAARMGTFFGVADFYSVALRRLGHEAMDVHFNNHHLQAAWARDQGVEVGAPPPPVWVAKPAGILRFVPARARSLASRTPLRRLGPTLGRIGARPTWGPWYESVLAAQIESFRPDVLLNQAVADVRPGLLAGLKPGIPLIVGQHPAIPLVRVELSPYDLVVSSFPPTVADARALGIAAELWRLAFEPRVTRMLRVWRNDVALSFVGNLTRIHSSRVRFLEAVHRSFPQLRIWGPGMDEVPGSSSLHSAYQGPAWGLEMYEVLTTSSIALNHHGDVRPFANNLRLYEATGVGTLLLTDWKENLAEILEPGREVVAYRSVDEAIEQIAYYLREGSERDAIARAGQQRTLCDHTYDQRVKEFVELIGRYLG